MTDKIVEIKRSKIGTVSTASRTILTPEEPITYQNCEELYTLLNEAIDQLKTEIILDFKNVSFIDSAGLELLVEFDDKLKNRGGVLKIVNVNAICGDVLVASRLINTFYIYKDIYDAVKSRP